MDGRVPIPTDNIFKFYAIFGFMLLLSSALAFIYLHKTTNETIVELSLAIEELDAKPQLSSVEAKRKEMLEKQVSIAVEDKKFFNNFLAIAFVLGIALATAGFLKWHYEVQPKQDKLLDLQIQKAEQDIQPPPRTPFRGPKK